MNNILNANSEVSELLINSDFLKLVRTFINIYGIDELIVDENINDFFSKLNLFRDKKNDIEDIFSKKELLENLGFIFSHEEILSQFIEHINYSNIDKKILYTYLEIADYLIKIYDNKSIYADNINIEELRLKDKVGEILGKLELNNTTLLIAKNNFPTIGTKGFPIVEIDFDNMIDFYGDGDINLLFAKVEDSEGNRFYHNYKGDIFLTNDGREIIDIEYIYYFNEYSILKVKTNDLQTSIEIRSKKGDTFDMPALDDVLPGKLIDGENELEYLTLSKTLGGITKTTLFDINGDTINLMDIITFINKGKDSTIKMLEMTLDKFNNIDVSFIKGIKQIEGVKFIELTLDLDDDLDIEGEPELYNIIMMESGKPLTDDNGEYIRHLFEIESFGGKELLGFGFTPYSIDGYIGSDGNILTIDDQLIHTIDNINMKFKGKSMYKINNDFIVREGKVKQALNKILGFNEVEVGDEDDGFSLFFTKKDNILIEKRKIDQLSCSNVNGKLNILLFSNGVSEEINYKDLVGELKEKKEYLELLTKINILIKTKL